MREILSEQTYDFIELIERELISTNWKLIEFRKHGQIIIAISNDDENDMLIEYYIEHSPLSRQKMDIVFGNFYDKLKIHSEECFATDEFIHNEKHYFSFMPTVLKGELVNDAGYERVILHEHQITLTLLNFLKNISRTEKNLEQIQEAHYKEWLSLAKLRPVQDYRADS